MKDSRRILQSLNCDGYRGLLLALLCAGLVLPAFGGVELRDAWRYDRAALQAGQWWRLATAHLAHLGVEHAVLNALGLVLLWALLLHELRTLQWLLVIALSAASIDVGLWFLDPSLRWYVGASGVLHGVMAAGCLSLLRRRDASTWLVLPLFIGKLVWEQAHGPLGFSSATNVIVDAHLYGAVGGTIAFCLLWLRGKRL